MTAFTDVRSLAAAVPSGATVAIGGFQLSRVPVALLDAVASGGARGLTCIAAPNPFGLEILSAAGAVDAAECGFIGCQYEHGFVVAPSVREQIASGSLRLDQPDVYDTIEKLRAAAGDTPCADFALLHAQRADRHGNLQIDDPYIDVELARASGCVLATVESVVDEIDRPTIEAARVQAIAVAERGAAPTACHGFYDRDGEAVGERFAQRPSAGAPATEGRRAGRAPRPAPSEDRASTAHRSAVDAQIVYLARQVHDHEVIATGLASAIPMLAIELARRTRAPNLTYINCIGAVNPRLDAALPTSVEPRLLADCDRHVDLAKLFDMARDGHVDAMIFGAAQIDAAGNINLTRIGPAEAPKVRLAGPAGSTSMRSFVRRVLVTVAHQSRRTLVAQVDDVTSAPAGRNEETVLVTDAATWRLEGDRLEPQSIHFGIDQEELSSRTGFAFAARPYPTTPPPSESELRALRALDAEGLRYRLLPAPRSSRKATREPEKVTP